MPIVKSFSVGNGDTFYIQHGSDNFTIIDCCLCEDNADAIIKDIKEAASGKGISRFISTHPDDDHFRGIEILDAEMPIANFYVVKNAALKDNDSESWERYCALRDDTSKAFYIYKGCTRKWMNLSDDTRKTSGIQILWPDAEHESFKDALSQANDGIAYNNISPVIRYSIEGGTSFMWLGDLETDFMVSITDSIELTKTTIVFASHHGRHSGKIPNSWLEKLDPQIIVIGEAPSRHLHYYTGYKTITQNLAGDIVMESDGDKVHIFVSSETYTNKGLTKETGVSQKAGLTYAGSITVETEYTL
jgi:beta-lactamase superfamily II metal-dependent hydrolase